MINLEADLVFALGGAVLHFLWQGTVIGLIAALLIRGLRKSSSESRYAVVLGSSVICLIVFLITFWGLVNKMPNTGGGLIAPATLIPSVKNYSGNMQQIVATIWAIGVGLLIARLAFHWLWSQRLRTRMVANPDGQWLEIFDELKAQMGISKTVKILKSGLAQTPMVVGWISPVVLVPAAAFASLSSEQMRMILAHELMHIRRYDHWVNQLQTLVEIILFFHPAVWWLSRQMRIEREYCCDDASLQVVPKPKVLAETLAQLELMRISSPTNSLAANGGSLMDRITRILDNRVRTKKTNKHNIMKIQTLGVIASAALLVGGITNLDAKDTKKVQVSKKQPAKGKLNYDDAIKKIKAAVKSGKLSREGAAKKIAAMKKELGSKKKSDPKSKYDATVRKIDDAAKLKDAAKEIAALRKEIAALKKELSSKKKGDPKSKYNAAIRKIKAAVGAGKLSKEDAAKKIAAMKKEWGSKKKGKSKKGNRK
ncbi:MAG: M56 family metallopeptidase [Verrucomicrobiota bacterium]|nr:M56 family metallopeptidase [Verrucomicrobiota bacterium]